MKVVDRDTFLKMPPGTVFSKIPLRDEGDGLFYSLSTGPASVLKEIVDNGFRAVEIGEMIPKDVDVTSHEAVVAGLRGMASELGKDVPCCSVIYQDDTDDDCNVGYAIYSSDDILDMISVLENALRNDYGIQTDASESDVMICDEWIKCTEDNYWQTDDDLCYVPSVCDDDAPLFFGKRSECPYGWNTLVHYGAMFMTVTMPQI